MEEIIISDEIRLSSPGARSSFPRGPLSRGLFRCGVLFLDGQFLIAWFRRLVGKLPFTQTSVKTAHLHHSLRCESLNVERQTLQRGVSSKNNDFQQLARCGLSAVMVPTFDNALSSRPTMPPTHVWLG